MRRRPLRGRRAFMLINMVITIGLMAGFVIVADRLFRLTMKTTESAARDQEELIRLDQAIGVLRADSWRGAKVEVQDKSTLLITAGPDDVVQWYTDESGYLVRTQNDDERRWTELGLEFEVQGTWLVVRHHGAEVALLRLTHRSEP